MRIGITLDEVLRDFVGHLTYVTTKINGVAQDGLGINENTLTDFDLVKWFGFSSQEEMNRLFYTEASLEIFGHPDQLIDNIMNDVNRFHNDLIEDERNVELVIINREIGRAIPSTLFFLSKTCCEIPNIKFVNEYDKVWDHVDVLVTANPILLVGKPEDKKTIKIRASYNTKSEGDYVFDTIRDFLKSDLIDELER